MAGQTSSRLIEQINPATGEVFHRVKPASRKEVEDVVQKARESFGNWREVRPQQRAALFEMVSKALREKKEKIAKLITLEMGKIIRESLAEVEKSASAFAYYAENGPGFLQPEPTKTDATDSYVDFQPLGVVAAIMPWNFPIWQCVRFATPALMAGNTTVFKPSSTTPQSALALQSAIIDSGIDSHCFNVVIGGGEVADHMIESPGTNAVSFTGSVSVGQKVAEAASRYLKKFVLELGGSDPFIVLGDADIETTAEGAVRGRFVNCGQSCIASKRFFVVKEVAKEFIERFITKTKSMKTGDPTSPDTDIGPMVRKDALEALDQQVNDSIRDGARVETGGRRLDRPGFYYAPTILTQVNQRMRVMKEEVFGPVAPVMIVENDKEAVKMANDSEYGLGASVWSGDVRRAERVAQKLEAGLVTVNNIVSSDPRMPFGGVKKSGIGRELSRYGILEFTNIRSVRIYEKSPVSKQIQTE
jgi:acyl-CoA reductase-like NAD-dependent aldehyde dehydrogenase